MRHFATTYTTDTPKLIFIFFCLYHLLLELLYFANKFVSADKCVDLILGLLMFNNKIANADMNTDDAIDPDILENYPRNLDISYYRFMFNNKVSIISNW
jgi:hypothetical protein